MQGGVRTLPRREEFQGWKCSEHQPDWTGGRRRAPPLSPDPLFNPATLARRPAGGLGTRGGHTYRTGGHTHTRGYNTMDRGRGGGARTAYLRVMASGERWPEASRAARPTAVLVCSAAVGDILTARARSGRPETRRAQRTLRSLRRRAATYG
jgi:hypothetical protein